MIALRKIWATLRHEPVAVWGAALAVLVGVLQQQGVSEATLAIVTAAASLLGIPVVRAQVSPVEPAETGDSGAVRLDLLLLLLALAGVVLLLFGVHLHWS